MENNYKKYAWVAGTMALFSISYAAIGFGMNNFSAIDHPNGQVASITVTGEGEVTAVPDMATVTFTVQESAKTVPEAQKLAEAKINEALKAVASLGVDKMKIRKIDQSGSIIAALGSANITEVSGPDFTVEDMDKAKADAKEIAIAKALAKAKVTAKSLDADLGAIIGFNENEGGAYPLYARAEAMSFKAMGGAQMAADVSLPQGENVIKSTVTITYSLK